MKLGKLGADLSMNTTMHATSQHGYAKCSGTNLHVSQVGSCVVLEYIRQQKAQQVLQLLQIVLQRRSRQHDALLAQHRHPARAHSSVTITQAGTCSKSSQITILQQKYQHITETLE